MKFFESIRGRLLLWYGLLFAAMLGGFGLTAWHLERASRFRQIDGELQRRISLITNALRAFHPPEPGKQVRLDLRLGPSDAALFDQSGANDFYYAVWLRGDQPAAQSGNAPRRLQRPDQATSSPRQHGSSREAFLFAPPVDCVLVGRMIDDDLAALQRLAWLLSGAGGGILVLGLTGGWWLVSHALRPVHEISSTAARIAGGDLSQRINISQTESELGGLASLLNSTFARLDSAFSQQARFTSDAAHELRTPVTVLLTQTQAALIRERSAVEYREALVANQSTAQRMRRLIESLLELARFDAGHEPLRRESCDLARIARDVIEHLRPLADVRNIPIQDDLSEARCHADPGRIAQVVTNLVTNAVEYNRDGGEVRISTLRRGDEAVLIVTDTGPGISPNDLPHIFERFYRADKSRSGAAPRTGLGLAISASIVEAHGGSLKAESDPGRGATFTMSLSAGADAAPP